MAWKSWPSNPTMSGLEASNRRRRALAVLGLIVGGWGCAPALTGLRRYEESLHLSVRLEKDRAPEHSIVPATASIRNDGLVALDFCIEHMSSGYEIAGADKRRFRNTYISHPGCSQRVKLRPGRNVEWSYPFDVLDMPPGPANITIDVLVVNPSTCRDFGGCDGTMRLKSAPIPLEIVAE